MVDKALTIEDIARMNSASSPVSVAAGIDGDLLAISRHIGAMLGKEYHGRFAAIANGEIHGFWTSRAEALSVCRQRGVTDPFVFELRVDPRDGIVEHPCRA